MPLKQNTPTELLTSPENAPSMDELLKNLPDYKREDIQAMTEKLLIAEMMGEIKLKSNQLTALNAIARKYLENPPTIKDEDDPIDFLALLNDAYQNNSTAFDDLANKALTFREQENSHRAALEKAKAEIKEQEVLGQHIPDVSSIQSLQEQKSNGAFDLSYPTEQNKENAPAGTDVESKKDNRFDEMVNIQGDGVQPSWPTDFVQHESG